MQKSPDLFDIRDICSYFGLSEATVRRRVKETREGTGRFVLPLFKKGSRLLWKRSDVESWSGEEGDTVTYSPPMTPRAPQMLQPHNLAEIHKRLEQEFNISVNSNTMQQKGKRQ